MYKVEYLTEDQMVAVIHDCLDMIKHHHANIIDCSRGKASEQYPYDPDQTRYFHERLEVWMEMIERKYHQYEKHKQCR